jgi:predicted ribosome quality control (RQC) complex YloA/Tae2 family protein
VNNQKLEAEKEINYIESIVFNIENAKSISDIAEIYYEISENIVTKKEFIKKKINTKFKKKNKEKEISLQSINIDGFTVYIGKNNIQNDYLSLKFANKNDIWFHTQKIHGSHVLLRNPNNLEISDNTLLKCASVAKENSKGRQSSNVAVDYTLAKYIKKPSGSKPGFVIYTNYKTIFVK